MLTVYFYPKRKEIIAKKLEEIKCMNTKQIQDYLLEKWNDHNGEVVVGIDWTKFELNFLQLISCCLGSEKLAGIFEILARDYRYSRSGLPDLILWKFNEENGEFNAKFVEVKGPSDKLSAKQRVWIDQLIKVGVDVEVCHVESSV